MKKGINAWCFPDSYGLAEMIEVAKKYNFEAIELNLSEDEEAVLHINSTDEELARISEQIRKQGLAVSSISTDLHWKYPLTGDSETSGKGKVIVEKMIKIADVLDARTILVVPGLVTAEVSYQEAYDRALAVLRDVSKTAEDHQVRIGIENVWNKFLLSPLEMKRFIDEINCSYIGSYLDIGNIVQFGYPEQWVDILEERIVSVHIKGFDESVGNITGFGPLLMGNIDWNSIRNALENIGYEGYIIPEIPPHQHHPDLLIDLTSQTMDHFFAK